MHELTCCFTGHRNLPTEAIEQITIRLNNAVENLINEGVTHFLCGGARGFDLIAAALIFSKKKWGPIFGWTLSCHAGIRMRFGRNGKRNCTIVCSPKRME